MENPSSKRRKEADVRLSIVNVNPKDNKHELVTGEHNTKSAVIEEEQQGRKTGKTVITVKNGVATVKYKAPDGTVQEYELTEERTRALRDARKIKEGAVPLIERRAKPAEKVNLDDARG